MCKYCENNKEILNTEKASQKSDGFCGISIWIENNELYVDASADTYEPNYEEGKTKINYCPMCGKKLMEE